MKKLLALVFCLLAWPVLAIDVGTIYNMPNPGAHNASTGALETGNGGSKTYYPNAAIASHQVLAVPGRLVRVAVTGSTTAIVSFWDDADGTCSSNQFYPPLTVASATVITTYEIGADVSAGICMLVATAADAEITVVSLP